MIAYPNIDPVAFSIGPLNIHWYGLAYVIGFLLVLFLGKYRSKTNQISLTTSEIDDLLLYGMIGLIIGARIGEVLLYHPDYYLTNPLEIIKVWKGGMSFHGGLVGVIVAVLLFARKLSVQPFIIFDAIAPLVPPGLFFGRVANFINSELIGRPTDVPWGMIFPYSDGLVRHPSQLYQAFFEGLVLFIILWYYSKPSKNSKNIQNSKNSQFRLNAKPIGAISGMFLFCYGCFRFLIEFTRTPDTFMGYFPLGLSMGQFLCIPMICFGGYLLFIDKLKYFSKNKN